MVPVVVAFDLSLSSTGVADRNGTRCICPKSKGEERLAEIRDAVLRACHFTHRHTLLCGSEVCDAIAPPWPRGTHPDLVVLEGYSYASGNKAHQIGELGGVVRVALREAGIAFQVVPPSVIKIYACGKGNASKDDVLLAAVRRLGYAGNSKDEADALTLYHLTMDALGAPLVKMPETHRKALRSLTWAKTYAAAVA